MKKSLTPIFLFALNLAHGQYFEDRFNMNYVVPVLRNERNNSGIRTQFNYMGNPAEYRFAAIGTSYGDTTLGVAPNFINRMRFTLLPRTGNAPVVNAGYQFAGGNGLYFNATGNSIAEVNNGAGNGGYVAVGSVSNNPFTGASGIAGGSDVLFTRIGANGAMLSASRININNGNDTAWCIRKSIVLDDDLPTWIMCGQTQSAAGRTDCFVARVRANGSIVWLYHYNFDPGGNNSARCIAKQLCEDATGKIYVVGTLQDNQGANGIDGLAFKLNPNGGVLWVENYHAGSDDQFQAVRLSNAGNSLVVGGFTNFNVAAPVEHNMLIVNLATAAGNINFQNILHASDTNGIKYTSKCYDIVETSAPNGSLYFLSGLLSRNNTNFQMMYKAGVNGVGINWYQYNKMKYNTGFGLDKVNATASSDLVYFSSMRNAEQGGFSDSHIKKVSNNGKTCKFCGSNPPSDISVNRQMDHPEALRSDVCNIIPLAVETINYDWRSICNQPVICPVVVPLKSEIKLPASGLLPASGSIKVLPNPANSILNIQFSSLPSGNYQITIRDLSGKLVLQKNSVYNNGSSIIHLDISSIPSGLYGLTVRQGALVLQQKIIKQ